MVVKEANMTLNNLVKIGIGVKSITYFKLVYEIFTGVNQYGILRVAYFGMN